MSGMGVYPHPCSPRRSAWVWVHTPATYPDFHARCLLRPFSRENPVEIQQLHYFGAQARSLT